jgi:tetratricopeptide (TPR) repeat protein/DNA-binding CsgD family transcriptional regulator
MKSIAKETVEITMTLKELSRAIVKIMQGGQNFDMQWIELRIRECADKESPHIQSELLNFIDTYVNRREFSAEDMHARIDKHCRVFAKYKYHEIRARAKVLLASHYHQTHKYISESFKALTEAELIVQRHLGPDNFILCEALFVRGGVYYSLGEMEKSTEALLSSQSLKGFTNASYAHQYKSHINISRNYIYLHDYKSAKQHLELAAKSWEHYGNIYDKGGLYMRKSDMLRHEGNWEESLKILIEGLNFYQEHDIKLRIAEFHKELGEFYSRTDNPLRSFTNSMNSFEEALKLSKELEILRLEAAIINSMWKVCKSFEEWKLCSQYLIEYNDVFEKIHQDEVDIYIKKIESIVLEEKKQLISEGKPTFTKALVDEVVQLREEIDTLNRKNMSLENIMLEVESLIDHNFNGNKNGANFVDQLHRMVARRKGNAPDLSAYLAECDKTFPKFASGLVERMPTITNMEMKVAKLIRLEFSSPSIAMLCGVTVKSIENHRMKLRKKANLKPDQSLSAFLHAI